MNTTDENKNVVEELPVPEIKPIDLSDSSLDTIEVSTEFVSKEEVVKDPVEKPKNVVQESEIFVPLINPKDEIGISLSFPSDSAENIDAALESMPNINIEETENGKEWAERISAARYTRPFDGWLDKTVTREDSLFKQSVMSEKGKLAAGGLKYKDQTNGNLTGERAVLRVRALTGLGTVIMVPLWHSGFWVTLKAPTEAAMLELNRRLGDEKITLGRNSYGLVYANTSVVFAGWLIDFALQHVYETSLKAEVAEDIREHISQLDIPLLIWGLANSVWPNGFPYARSVLDQTTEQTKIIKEKVNVGRLLWVDNNSLTPWQISHMSERFNNTMTLESLKRYRSEFTRGKGRLVKLNDHISVNLRIPSSEQYLTSGQKWINNIVAMVDRAFSMNTSDSARDNYIMDHGKATNMRQFAHFVESIEVADGIITDLDTIEQTFDSLSASDDIRDAFFKGVKEFIEESTIAVIAIPATEDNDKSELPRFPRLLVIDVMSVFFIQLVTMCTRIQGRI